MSMSRTWNTGREYSESGQEITAVYVPTDDPDNIFAGGAYFHDAARGIYGYTEFLFEPVNNYDIQHIVMQEYDGGRYTDVTESEFLQANQPG